MTDGISIRQQKCGVRQLPTSYVHGSRHIPPTYFCMVTVQRGNHAAWQPYIVATMQRSNHAAWLPCSVVTTTKLRAAEQQRGVLDDVMMSLASPASWWQRESGYFAASPPGCGMHNAMMAQKGPAARGIAPTASIAPMYMPCGAGPGSAP